MTVGMSSYVADATLNAIGNNTAFPTITTVYMQLHVGDPGAAGTANKATEVTRKAVSFGSPQAGATGYRKILNDAAVTWTNIAGSQDATNCSLWDAATDGTGNYLGSGVITAPGYTAGDTYNIAIGEVAVQLPIATT